jgi:hypothetical protein
MEELQEEVRRLQKELNKEKQAQTLELTKIALSESDAKAKGRRSEMLTDDLKSENDRLLFDIISLSKKIAMREKEERRAYLRLKEVLHCGGTGDGGGGDEEKKEEEAAALKNFNFEEQLDRLIAEYQQKSEWGNNMDRHVATLSTQLEQYTRKGTSERQVLEKQAKILEELMEAQQAVAIAKRKHQGVVRKLALSEKSNSLLASRLSFKSDQLHQFLERAERSESLNTLPMEPLAEEAAKREEKELLDYLRLFSKEWGHPIYSDLQQVVGYQKEDEGVVGGGVGGGGGMRRKSLF